MSKQNIVYNKGNILVGIIITLVVVSLFGGGFYYYLQKQIPDISEYRNQGQGPASEEAIPTDWQTFTKNKSGFSISLPPEYLLEDETDSSVSFDKNDDNKINSLDFAFYGVSSVKINIDLASAIKYIEALNKFFTQLVENSDKLSGKKIDSTEYFSIKLPGSNVPQRLVYGTDFISAEKIHKENCTIFSVTSLSFLEESRSKRVVVFPDYNQEMGWFFDGLISYSKKDESQISKIIKTIKCTPVEKATPTPTPTAKKEITVPKFSTSECDKISVELDRNICYGQKAVEALDESMCVYAGSLQDVCYFAIAEDTWSLDNQKETAVCNKIADSLIKCSCLVRVSGDYQDEYETCRQYIPPAGVSAIDHLGSYLGYFGDFQECVIVGGTIESCKQTAIPVDTAETRDKKRVADIDMLHTALELYYGSHDAYPILEDDGKDEKFLEILKPTIQKTVLDPLNPQYFYTYKSTGQSFTLTAKCEIGGGECDMKDGKQDQSYIKR